MKRNSKNHRQPRSKKNRKKKPGNAVLPHHQRSAAKQQDENTRTQQAFRAFSSVGLLGAALALLSRPK